MDYAAIKAKKAASRRTVTIVLDAALMSQIEELRRRITVEERQDRKLNRPEVAPGLKDQLDALIAQARESETTFTFRSIGRAKFEELQAKYPPTPEQRQKAKDDAADQQVPYEPLKWDYEAFPPVLMALSCEDPKLTLEEAQEIWTSEDWSPAELLRLFNCALGVHYEVGQIPFVASGIAQTGSTEQSWTSALSEESPGASS